MRLLYNRFGSNDDFKRDQVPDVERKLCLKGETEPGWIVPWGMLQRVECGVGSRCEFKFVWEDAIL